MFRQSKSLKCKDCLLISESVNYSFKYKINLCIICLMLRIKKEITES